MARRKMIRTYNGATAIITGGASGIGRAFGQELAKRGCEVVLADLQVDLAEKTAAAICTTGGKATAAKVDVANFEEIQQLVQQTFDRTGRLDFMFNNAGIGIGGNVDHYRINDWKQIVNVNLHGIIHGVQAAYTLMVSQGFGHIVNTASMAGLVPSPGLVSYATTKHAVVGLSTSMRAEAAQFGIGVSVVCPGVIRTPILEGGGKYGKMLIDIPPEKIRRLWKMYKPMEPDIFAGKVLNSVTKNKAIIIVPSWWKLFWWSNRFFPSLVLYFAEKSFQDIQKKLAP